MAEVYAWALQEAFPPLPIPLAFDLRILLATARTALSGRGVIH